MKKELVTDEAILSQRCARATAQDSELVQDLIDTVLEVEDGACLAANQIGVTKQVIVWLDDDRTPHVMLNPHIMMGLQATRVVEGCLTREEPSKAMRYAKIKLSWDEIVEGSLRPRKGDFTGWEAQMIQHMVDHCNGKLV